jgi:hypothetical protein
MTALTVLGCILLFLALLLSLKATVCVIYNGEVSLYVKVLFVKIKILPKDKKKKGPHSMSVKKAERIKKKLEKKAEKKRQRALEKQRKKQEKKELSKNAKQEKKSLSDILDMLRMVTDITKSVISTFFGHLRVKVAHLHINVATGDAATTAIAYGAISEAVFYLYETIGKLDGISLPDRKDVSVNADYLSDNFTADVKICFSIRVWHVLHVGFVALGKLLKHLVKMKSKNTHI